LDKDPNDVKGQMMLGRSYMVMERWQEAETAWRKVIELDERSSMGHASLGEILLRSHPPGDTQIAKEALEHFDKALIGTPQNPSILWARGIALIALNRPAEADAAWTEAYQMITPGTEESEMLKNALAALRSGKIPGT
jgi:cytochrome c-type biogenesis protein CcmH